MLLGMWIPLGLALVFVYALVAWLGWWRPVFRDERPVQRWVWAVPAVFVVCIVLAIDYSALSEKSLGFVLALVVATQMVSWGDEGMFRGIGDVTLRDHGLPEGTVALWSSVVFGLVHITNALGSRGAGALGQAVAVSLAGYFLYLVRRAARSTWLNSVLHGFFDFAILTGTAILVDQKAYAGSVAAVLAYLVLGILLVVRRRHIEPAATPPASAAAA
ncbi:CPBP family glutamic-type intramembrane protease [Cellulomonas edaphi]|uniref:CPBP family glutamic-type intramembrane protease n=1 Tax=Cellulomonas edaphi TaxID=3053468 RepID=A0ABT7S906_9CELL|nr:CPBP family glutamic-type intramembrane protease [Cellulomons edaphi]MDM7832109.1 CPBP family glutamic-type intramembrane protease [Cellulomons edaphi]